MSSNRRHRWAAFVAITLACASASSFALTMPYYASQGAKENFTVAAPPPLTPAFGSVVSNFKSAITTLGSNEFEGTAPTVGFSYTGGTASLGSGAPVVINGDTLTADQLGQGRYNMTPGVVNPITNRTLFGHWLEATSDFSLRFSSAVSAFGFYGTDFGDFDGTFSIDFLSGANVIYTTPVSNAGTNGNLLFFGLTSDVAFDSVVFHITQRPNSEIDILGFDSFIVGRALPVVAPVPEPGSLALVGLALAGLGVTTSRIRRTRHS